MDKEKEITLKDVKIIAKSWYLYLRSKWKSFFIIAIIFGLIGVAYAWFDKPVYTAQLTFAAESEGAGGIGAYAGLAAQFGFDLGGGTGSAFEGDNLMRLMTSRKLIEKALFSTVVINEQKLLLINYFLKVSGIEKGLKAKPALSNIVFTSEITTPNRERDSLLQKICIDINKSLWIEKLDKKSDIISVQYSSNDEVFAKIFVEQLVNNVIQFYTDSKVKKTRQNVEILQRQTDSVRGLINGNIVDIAVSNDLNVNPTRQIVRTGIQRKQVDAQVNNALYTELVKNLELSKLSLRKETPFVQVIDTPVLPLKKERMGRLKSGILFAVLGIFLTGAFLFFKRIFSI